MNATVRCAIYARYSSDLQRLTSIEDQLRRSRAARHSNLSLLLLPPFDCLVVDDTSRLARYLPDVLKMNDSLQYHGVFIYAVAQRLDCREKTSRPLLTLHGMMDEQFLVSLGEKVHRGQEGRALNGFQPGGKCYGYRNVPIEDPTRSGKYGRFAISGVKLEIDEEEAAVVRRIFEMYAGGNSQATISKRLNAEGMPAPNPPRTRQVRAWCVSSIFEMLRNERYRGVFVWNRTKKERNPETGRKTSRPRPESDWKRIDVPEWRIVSEELWERAQARKRFAGKRFSASHLGGFNRSERSKRYIFSGFLVCGVCGSKLVIASGSGKRGYVKYGCPSHRYRGTCSNGLMIKQDRLETQLIAGLTERVSKSELIEYALKRFQEQLQMRLRDIQEQTLKAADAVSALQNQRRELKERANNLDKSLEFRESGTKDRGFRNILSGNQEQKVGVSGTAFRANSKFMSNDFLAEFMMSASFQRSLQLFASGSTAAGIKSEHLAHLFGLIPPIEEQKAIVADVRNGVSKVDAIQKPVRKTLEHLVEFRIALITAAVTGIIDVATYQNQSAQDESSDSIEAKAASIQMIHRKVNA